MAIITIITKDTVKTTTGLDSAGILSSLDIKTNKNTAFRDETMRKLSSSMSGMIPSFKGYTEVALVPHAGINP